MEELAKWLFLGGVVIAFVLGITAGIGQSLGVTATLWLTLLLVIIGIVVGFVNITKKETTPFLVAAVALVLVNSAGLANINTLIPYLGDILSGIVVFVIAMVAPAALVVGLRAFYQLASTK